MAEQPDQPEQEQKPTRYGGGRWKKWLLIYLIAAGIIYLIVYLVFLRDSGYSGSGGGNGGGTGGYFALALPFASAAWEHVRGLLRR